MEYKTRQDKNMMLQHYAMPCHAMLYDTVQDNEKREKKRSKIRIKARIQNGNMVYKTMMCKQLKGECECCA